MTQWSSIHLYFEGGIYSEECDQLLLHVVEPVQSMAIRSRGWADRGFFVRYVDDRPHVRIRLRPVGVGPVDWLESMMVEAIQAYDADESSAVRIRGFRCVEYEPEVDRYGGPRALLLSERHFHDASEVAFQILDRVRNQPRSTKLGAAWACMIASCKLFMGSLAAAIAFGRRYASGLRSASPEAARAFHEAHERQLDTLRGRAAILWTGLEKEGALGDPVLSDWCARLVSLRTELHSLVADDGVLISGRPAQSWHEAVGKLLPSYVHMMNNRLGISIPEEQLLGHLMARALEPLSVSAGRPMESAHP